MKEQKTSPAVYGIETEYSCMLTLPGDVVYEIVGSCHSDDAEIGLYQQPDNKGSSDISSEHIASALEDMGLEGNTYGMLSNGGRFYIDPSGPEYATPETTSAKDAVHRMFEGDKLLLKFFDKLCDDEVLTGYQVNRRTVDHNRTSRGIHLNTLTKLADREPTEKIALWLATLNVAKGALFGAGGLLVGDDGTTAFHHSPRLSVTTELMANYAKYQHRPLVRAPFKEDGLRLSRIETVTSDALNFGWPLRASLVATNAIVGLMEMGYGDKLPTIKQADAVASAHSVGEFGHEGLIVVESEGKRAPALRSLDVIREIGETILEVNSKEKHLDKESSQVIHEIIIAADKMAADPYSVADQVESMARLVAMERKMEKDDVPIDSERICRFDYAWDWVGGGIAETLRSKGKIGWQGFGTLPSPAATKKRLITPPKDTRAHVRGAMIKLQAGTDDSNWHDIDFGNEQTRYIQPLQTNVPEDITLFENLA